MANDPYIQSFTCFDGTRRLLTAALPEVALALKQAVAGGAAGPLLVFDNATGRSVDLDIRGSSEDQLARLVVAGERQPAEEAAPRGRGRPKLGVVAREVTLLPHHWEWLAAQPGAPRWRCASWSRRRAAASPGVRGRRRSAPTIS